jgi:hypothetical protein
MNCLPVFLQAIPVVPDPMQGSKTTSFGLEYVFTLGTPSMRQASESDGHPLFVS